MASYAKGKHALGISDRSGFRYPLHRMRKEWNGALVGYDEWESKHPQLEPRHNVVDAQAIRDARPDRIEPLIAPVGAGGFPNRGVETKGSGQVGTVTVVIA
jgi:hypothetical protein